MRVYEDRGEENQSIPDEEERMEVANRQQRN